MFRLMYRRRSISKRDLHACVYARSATHVGCNVLTYLGESQRGGLDQALLPQGQQAQATAGPEESAVGGGRCDGGAAARSCNLLLRVGLVMVNAFVRKDSTFLSSPPALCACDMCTSLSRHPPAPPQSWPSLRPLAAPAPVPRPPPKPLLLPERGRAPPPPPAPAPAAW